MLRSRELSKPSRIGIPDPQKPRPGGLRTGSGDLGSGENREQCPGFRIFQLLQHVARAARPMHRALGMYRSPTEGCTVTDLYGFLRTAILEFAGIDIGPLVHDELDAAVERTLQVMRPPPIELTPLEASEYSCLHSLTTALSLYILRGEPYAPKAKKILLGTWDTWKTCPEVKGETKALVADNIADLLCKEGLFVDAIQWSDRAFGVVEQPPAGLFLQRIEYGLRAGAIDLAKDALRVAFVEFPDSRLSIRDRLTKPSLVSLSEELGLLDLFESLCEELRRLFSLLSSSPIQFGKIGNVSNPADFMTVEGETAKLGFRESAPELLIHVVAEAYAVWRENRGMPAMEIVKRAHSQLRRELSSERKRRGVDRSLTDLDHVKETESASDRRHLHLPWKVLFKRDPVGWICGVFGLIELHQGVELLAWAGVKVSEIASKEAERRHFERVVEKVLNVPQGTAIPAGRDAPLEERRCFQEMKAAQIMAAVRRRKWSSRDALAVAAFLACLRPMDLMEWKRRLCAKLQAADGPEQPSAHEFETSSQARGLDETT